MLGRQTLIWASSGTPSRETTPSFKSATFSRKSHPNGRTLLSSQQGHPNNRRGFTSYPGNEMEKTRAGPRHEPQTPFSLTESIWAKSPKNLPKCGSWFKKSRIWESSSENSGTPKAEFEVKSPKAPSLSARGIPSIGSQLFARSTASRSNSALPFGFSRTAAGFVGLSGSNIGIGSNKPLLPSAKQGSPTMHRLVPSSFAKPEVLKRCTAWPAGIPLDRSLIKLLKHPGRVTSVRHVVTITPKFACCSSAAASPYEGSIHP